MNEKSEALMELFAHFGTDITLSDCNQLIKIEFCDSRYLELRIDSLTVDSAIRLVNLDKNLQEGVFIK